MDIAINKNLNKTLSEIYYPNSLDDLYLPARIRDLIGDALSKDKFRLLLHSSPGTGKSSTAKLIVKTNDHEVMYLSGSNDFTVEVLRSKIYGFAGTTSVMGKRKTIIIDEANGMRKRIQEAFKIILDQSKSVNFIFITNIIGEMDDAIKSRCTNICYDFTENEQTEQFRNYATFTVKVCKEQNITYEGAAMEKLLKMIFPDFRHLLIMLEQFKATKQVVNEENVRNLSATIAGKSDPELYEMIISELDSQKIYTKATEYKSKERETILSLGEPFLIYLNNQGKFAQTLKAAIIVAKYSNMMESSYTPFTTLFGCISELKSIFR